MPAILLRLHPPRASFPADASPAEQRAMEAHAAWWQDRADEGRAVAAGPVIDPAAIWGLAIVHAEDTADALTLVRDDPVIVADLGFRYDALPMGELILPQR